MEVQSDGGVFLDHSEPFEFLGCASLEVQRGYICLLYRGMEWARGDWRKTQSKEGARGY